MRLGGSGSGRQVAAHPETSVRPGARGQRAAECGGPLAHPRQPVAGRRWRARGIGATVVVLAMLSLYRETIGLPVFYLVLLTSILFWVAQATS